VPTVPLTRQQSPGTGDDDRPDQGHRPGGDDVGDEPGRSEDSEDKGDDRGQSNEVPAIERDGRVRTEGGDADETEDDAGDDAEGSSGIRGSDRSDSKTRQRGAPRVFSHAS
jgi:hypothetical protein